MSANIFGSGVSILDSGANLLSVGRQAFSGIRGVGLSSSSRQLLEGFFNNGSALFNQLYSSTENQEANNVQNIMALRSKYSYLVSDSVKASASDDSSSQTAAASTTTGTQVDTSA